MKWGEAVLWKEFDRCLEPFYIIHAFVFQTYNLNKILSRNMNCQTESIFTGHSVY